MTTPNNSANSLTGTRCLHVLCRAVIWIRSSLTASLGGMHASIGLALAAPSLRFGLPLDRPRSGMSPPRRRRLRIFVSHRFRHSHHLQALIELLAPQWVLGVDYILMCPTSDDPLHPPHDAALELELEQLIRASDLFWALAGVYASHGYYMGFESRVALQSGTAQFAIAPHHQSNLSVVATADGEREVVHWRCESIIGRSLDLLPSPLAIAFRRETLERELDELAAAFPPHERGRIGSPAQSTAADLYDPLDPLMDQIIRDADGRGALGAIGNLRARDTGVFGALGVDPLRGVAATASEAYARRLGERACDYYGALEPPAHGAIRRIGEVAASEAAYGPRLASRCLTAEQPGTLDHTLDDDDWWDR